jgi:hypothetical protein
MESVVQLSTGTSPCATLTRMPTRCIAMYGTARIADRPLGKLATVRIRFVHGEATVNTITADEVGRLRAAEHAAERHYGEIVKDSNLSAVRNAAAEWRKAADALTQYLAKHPYPNRDSG